MSEAVREQNERRISSPEELHDYMHVTGPGLWVMLAMIIILLAGLIILASTVTMENTMAVQVIAIDTGTESQPTTMLCTLSGDRKGQIKIGMKVRVAEEEGTISTLVEDDEEVVATIVPDRNGAKLKAGTYDAEIVLESTSPVSFLMDH